MTTKTAARATGEPTAIRPFSVHFPDEALADLKRRIVATRWPPKELVAVTAFPEELYQAPRSWTEKAYPKLIYYNKVSKGGHFAAWEQPALFTTEMRAAFKSLR